MYGTVCLILFLILMEPLQKLAIHSAAKIKALKTQ